MQPHATPSVQLRIDRSASRIENLGTEASGRVVLDSVR
jgi:hypothetical protein